MKSFTQAFTIIASSGKDMELYASEMEGFETFKKNGKTMHYNKVTEDGATVYMLMIEYPKEDAIISIAATYMSSKDNLLKIASMLNF